MVTANLNVACGVVRIVLCILAMAYSQILGETK
uniref:Uncharacterized protein n=1 Tax=Anguilla anguilla TaxID=7936 RepID=A0A0E9XLL2_ANGAN